PENGTGDEGQVLADDVKFAGSTVDEICWNSGFYVSPFSGAACVMNIDTTWEIRIYDTDPACDAIPANQIGFSTITVLNKIEGTGQATATWHYAGTLDTPIVLPNGGLAGDTYWFEVSGRGEAGCSCHATWSRDHGNEHHVTSLTNLAGPSERDYAFPGIGDVDVGFCENSGIVNPGDVLGSCCTCPANCQEAFTQRECSLIRGVWLACATCAETPCSGPPANDDCESAEVVVGVPATSDGSAFVTVVGENICAGDDGPGLSADPLAGCSGSLIDGADLHNDVWYAYTATECADLTIESCNDVDFDQMIAVYGASGGCPLTDADEFACSDDDCAISGGASKVTLRVAEGSEYLIRVGGWNDEVPGGFNGDPRGTFSLRWSLTNGVCPAVFPPIRAAEPHDILKNRYISIDPRGEGPEFNPPSHHIRVAVSSTLVPDLIVFGPWWATAPITGQPPSPA
ncbi:MAG: hypothetical protein IH987_11355, partial [Planctomycetes bacterium]|nr:hypothetical protein [Planctomycetota bacterium]